MEIQFLRRLRPDIHATERLSTRFYDDYDDKRFGFFRMNRALWDRRWRLRDENVRQLAQLRSIWHRYTDGDGNVLPYHERTPKPIVYYLNTEHPYDLMDEMGLVSEDYDVAFRRIVMHYQTLLRGQSTPLSRMYPACFTFAQILYQPIRLPYEAIPDHERERLERIGPEFALDPSDSRRSTLSQRRIRSWCLCSTR